MKKSKYLIVLLGILFLNNLDVNAANEGDVFNVKINDSTLRTTNSLYINQGNVTFNLSNSFVYEVSSLVPQYGVVAYCSGVGKEISNFYATNVSNVSLYNTGMPCSIYGKEDGYSNEQLVYVTFTLAYSSGLSTGVKCSASLTNCYLDGISFTIYNPSTDEITLKHAYLTNTLPDIQMNPNGSKISAIQDQNEAIINNGNATNNKLDEQIEQNKEAEETRKGIWETIKNLPKAFLDILLGLFIPDDMDFLNDFVDVLEDKLGFIASIPIQLIEFITSLVTTSWETFDSISLPSISIFGYNFWNAQEIDLTEAINIFKPFKYVTDVICVVICARTLNRWRETFSGGGSGE